MIFFASFVLGIGNGFCQLTVLGYTKFYSPNTFSWTKLGLGLSSVTLCIVYFWAQTTGYAFQEVNFSRFLDFWIFI